MSAIPFLILGGGAAAFSAATRANDLGVPTVMINAGLPIGGTCVNVGCVPSKHLLSAAAGVHAARHTAVPGLTVSDVSLDYRRTKAARDALVLNLRESNYAEVLKVLQSVELMEGFARFVDPHTVEVNGRHLRAEKILVAVGSRPRDLPIPGWNLDGVLDHQGALSLEAVPERLVVIGGGPQGLEWAQAFSRLGGEVVVLEALGQVLSPLDPDVSQVVQDALVAEGVVVNTRARLTRIDRVDGGLLVTWSDGEAEHRIEATHVLKAVGVSGNADRIQAQAARLTVKGGFVPTDGMMSTTVPHIFAAGDVNGRFMLEHAAGTEGKTAAANALSDAGLEVDYASMPAAVFTDPEVAWVGPTERDYMKEHGVCKCRHVRLDRVPRALATGHTQGIARLTIHHETERVVGAQLVGPHAGDAIHEIVVAIKVGMHIDDLIDTVHAFPTYSEAFKIAALAYRRDISVMACCIG
jgi:mercuric reductase